MKLHIEHLTKVEKADIEHNGITLIAGENNTGKSSVGKALYCIFSSFYNFHEQIKKEKADALEIFVKLRTISNSKLQTCLDEKKRMPCKA